MVIKKEKFGIICLIGTWISFKFYKEVAIKNIYLYCYGSVNLDKWLHLGRFELQGSNDGKSWSCVESWRWSNYGCGDVGPPNPDVNAVKEPIDNPVKYNYFRLYFTDSPNCLAEFGFDIE